MGVACIVIGILYGISNSLMSAFLPLPGGNQVNRREMIQGLAASATALGAKVAWADNQGEKIKAMNAWGPKILGLKDAVAAGDTKAVLKKDREFKLLTTYWRNNKADFKEMNVLYEGIMEAAYAGKADEMKDLYNKYIDRKELKTFSELPPFNRYHNINVDSSFIGISPAEYAPK